MMNNYCQNSPAYNPGGSGILSPQCYNNEATHELKIFYDKHNVSIEILHLCEECMKRIKRDARRHGYRVRGRKLS